MTEKTAQDYINQQTRREIEEFERDPIRKNQRTLDWFWERRLEVRAAARRRALGDLPGGCDPESGRYDPFARLANEPIGWGRF